MNQEPINAPLIRGRARFDRWFRIARAIALVSLAVNLCVWLTHALERLPLDYRWQIQVALQLVCGISTVLTILLWFHREEIETDIKRSQEPLPPS